ncbi:MAG: Flp pilus assembly protein CpaB [Faecousia sp.]
MKKLKLIALFAAAIVGLGVYRFLQELNKPQEAPHTMVVVAAVNIPENTRITADMVTLRSISDDSLLANYMVDTESVIGMVMTGDVYAGEQIIRDRLVRIGETDTNRKTLAYAVKPGMRAVTIFVDQDTGLVNFLKPGNRVDVLANYTREETRPVLNKEEELEWVQIPTTQLLAQNVQILAVGSSMDKNGASEYTTVTLEVTPQDALNISAVDCWGSLRLLPRSALDDGTIELEPADQTTVFAGGA